MWYLTKLLLTQWNKIIKAIAALNYEITPNPLPFYATQIINPILNSRISTNHDKVERFSANCEIFKFNKGIVFFLSFVEYLLLISLPDINSWLRIWHFFYEKDFIYI